MGFASPNALADCLSAGLEASAPAVVRASRVQPCHWYRTNGTGGKLATGRAACSIACGNRMLFTGQLYEADSGDIQHNGHAHQAPLMSTETGSGLRQGHRLSTARGGTAGRLHDVTCVSRARQAARSDQATDPGDRSSGTGQQEGCQPISCGAHSVTVVS